MVGATAPAPNDAPSADAEVWHCAHCTYANTKRFAKQCEMCKKPRKKSPGNKRKGAPGASPNGSSASKKPAITAA